ncbi:hypothetical protein DER44DRAFT_752028 [Fusarium oxysporum]|nr:hypothetical protein DER44DRAFT_752028 [Fusarium oxysporum]
MASRSHREGPRFDPGRNHFWPIYIIVKPLFFLPGKARSWDVNPISKCYTSACHENGQSSVPSQTQGKPQPEYENGKPSVSIHGSPEPTHNNGTYHPPARPTVSTSQPGAAVIPSASAPNNKG